MNSTEQRKDFVEQGNKNGDRRGMHPNSRKNLIPFEKGVSGNPKGQSITARQSEKYDEVCPFDTQARTWRESLAEGGMRQALTTPAALSNLQDRQEGKVPEKHAIIQDTTIRFVIGQGYEKIEEG